MSNGQVKTNVLIVDDMTDNLALLSDLLLIMGYQVRPVMSGKMALQTARLATPDLVLLDINMPDMDGYEVCQAFKADTTLKEIPVIFISALDDASEKVRAFQVGGADYITKPFQFEEVLARVENQLTLSRQRQELQERYQQIQHLQSIVRTFLSPSAWENVEADSRSSETVYLPQFETLTILMSDIQGFTAVAEEVEPNLLITDLNLYMNILVTLVYQNQGEIDKFLGDGMFAFFRDAKQALNTAFHIQRQVAAFNERQVARHRYPLPTRVSLATGRVLLAKLGSHNRHEYTLIGDRVNVAARLQSQVNPGDIMIDEATFQGAAEPNYQQVDMISLRGKGKAERIYTIGYSSILKSLPDIDVDFFSDEH